MIKQSAIHDASFWGHIYDILTEECGAGECDRQYFIDYCIGRVPSGIGPSEFRFQGALGFGGKFRSTAFRMWVDCYLEDETEERRGMIERANERLKALF